MEAGTKGAESGTAVGVTGGKRDFLSGQALRAQGEPGVQAHSHARACHLHFRLSFY